MAVTREHSLLSSRGKDVRDFPDFLLKYASIVQGNRYDRNVNPSGYVDLGVAESTLCEDLLAAKLSDPEVSHYETNMQYYFEFRGTERFRATLGHFLSERFRSAKPIDPEKLVVTSGAAASIDLLGYLYFDEGDSCLVHAPYYSAILGDLGIRSKVKTSLIPLSQKPGDQGGNPFTPNVADMEEALMRANQNGERVRGILLVNPHNPTGNVLTRQQLIEILQFAKRHDLHVISDEIFALSMLIPDENFTSVLSIEDIPCPEKTHFVWAFSKDFGISGFRCGVVYTLNSDFVTAAKPLLFMGSVPMIVQERLRMILADEDWLDNVYFPTNKKRMKESCEYMLGRLRNLGVNPHVPKAAFFIWVNLSKFMTSVDRAGELELFERLLTEGVYCVPGTALYCDEPGWFRFVFTHPTLLLEEGLSRLERALIQH